MHGLCAGRRVILLAVGHRHPVLGGGLTIAFGMNPVGGRSDPLDRCLRVRLPIQPVSNGIPALRVPVSSFRGVISRLRSVEHLNDLAVAQICRCIAGVGLGVARVGEPVPLVSLDVAVAIRDAGPVCGRG